MNPEDTRTVQQLETSDNTPARLTLATAEDANSDRMKTFCDDLKSMLPHMIVKKNSEMTYPEPVILVGRHQNIAYSTLPTGKILPLFLEALDPAAPPVANSSKNGTNDLDLIELPAALKLYISDACPHCPQTLRATQRLAAQSPLIRLHIINVDIFQDSANNDQIRSVPTLILDDQFRWIGQVNLAELIKMCAQRNPSQLTADSLRQLIEDGDAERLADLMTQSDQIFPAFIELLLHHRWSVRLGAMVTVEYLVDTTPSLSRQLCLQLWERFSQLSPQVQGDVAHLFGLVDADTGRGYLQQIIEGNYTEEVLKTAAEVLEEIDGGPSTDKAPHKFSSE